MGRDSSYKGGKFQYSYAFVIRHCDPSITSDMTSQKPPRDMISAVNSMGIPYPRGARIGRDQGLDPANPPPVDDVTGEIRSGGKREPIFDEMVTPIAPPEWGDVVGPPAEEYYRHRLERVPPAHETLGEFWSLRGTGEE